MMTMSILIQHVSRRTVVNWLQVPDVNVESHRINGYVGMAYPSKA